MVLCFTSVAYLRAIHKVCHAIFGQFWPPPPVTLCHTSRDPPKYATHLRPPNFNRPSKKNLDKIPLYKFSLNCSFGFFSGGFCQGVFCLVGFLWGGFCLFPLLSKYICYNRKLNIILNFRFYMYDKKIYKCDVTCSCPPLLCHKLSHLFGPPPPRAWRTYRRLLRSFRCN